LRRVSVPRGAGVCRAQVSENLGHLLPDSPGFALQEQALDL
jgi:hypothetical protein